MYDAEFARGIHELSVVLWIGGVGFVTTVLMPVIRHTRPPQERLATFQPFGNFFAWQARNQRRAGRHKRILYDLSV